MRVLVYEEHDGAPRPQPHDLGHQSLVQGSEPKCIENVQLYICV